MISIPTSALPTAALARAFVATFGFALAGAQAQQPEAQAKAPAPVAKLTQLSGNVLVSREAALVAGAESMPILPGARVITTANARVVVEFENGCKVKMEPSQRLEVDERKECKALVAQSTLATPQAAVGPGLASILIPGGAVGAGAGALASDDRKPVSPN